ncbi:MAG TPA: T9SS type A sorting domain-containing protein [Chitinophagaceae bacterium]
MKKFLLSTAASLLAFSFTMHAQSSGNLTNACDLYDILVQNVRSVDADPNDGKCYVTFNVAFSYDANNGSKYVFIQSYIESVIQNGIVNENPPHDYPNYFDCQNGVTSEKKPPLKADAGDPLLNIAIDNSGDNPFFTEYIPDNTLDTIGATSASGITKVTLANGDTRFMLTDIQVILPYECGSQTQYFLATDVFATNAEKAKTLHCVSCGIKTVGGAVTVAGQTLCDLVNASLTNSTSTDQTVTYELFADNGDGVLATENTEDVLFETQTGTVMANSAFTINYSLQNQDLVGRDVFVVINIGGARRAQLLPSVQCAPLPVSFNSFTANRNKATVNLKWVTATEQNSKGFDLQRETGNNQWQSIAYIPSLAVDGNSNGLLTYTYADLNNSRGITNYRIRQIDLDGKMKYSPVRSVRGQAQTSGIIVYPNPSNTGAVSVLFDEETFGRDIQLTDISGRVLRRWNNITDNNLQISNLTAGMYTLKIMNRETGEVDMKKIVVSR